MMNYKIYLRNSLAHTTLLLISVMNAKLFWLKTNDDSKHEIIFNDDLVSTCKKGWEYIDINSKGIKCYTEDIQDDKIDMDKATVEYFKEILTAIFSGDDVILDTTNCISLIYFLIITTNLSPKTLHKDLFFAYKNISNLNNKILRLRIKEECVEYDLV